ncbi:MAG: potassium channel family protein [Pseudomonadota bacterium]
MDRPRPIRALRTLFEGIWEAIMDVQVRLLVGLTVSIISIATMFYHFVEGWAWIDAAYFSTVTIATVGYGDFVPKTDIGKVFTMVYTLLGIGVFVAACSALAERLIRKAREEEKNRRRAARKEVVKRAYSQQTPPEP